MSPNLVVPDTRILCAVINWNGWQDTIICLESLFQVKSPPFQLVVCDNGSNNDSCERLAHWLTCEAGGRQGAVSEFAGGSVVRFDGAFGAVLQSLYLLRIPTNLGYAGALNRCIQWGSAALAASDYWLLNNDVRCDPGALTALVAAAESSPDIGLVGSVLMDWDDPQAIRAVAGSFRRPFAVGVHTTRMPDRALPGNVLPDIDYPVGASLFATKRFVDKVGLMDERYFLYYEEMDWAERGRRLGFHPAVALDSRIQHKEGASTGSHGKVRKKPLLAERYGVVNRLRFTRKFWPWYLPLVWVSLWLVVADRLLHGEFKLAAVVLRLMFLPGRLQTEVGNDRIACKSASQ